MSQAGYMPIEHHGVIGDLYTLALVAVDGTIDFMCFPDFDSPSVFASLLDAENGGSFQLAPDLSQVRYKQIYLPDTNILLTRFLSSEGLAEIMDFMPIEGNQRRPAHCVVRIVRAIRNDVPIRLLCHPRFNYGQSPHRLEAQGNGVAFVDAATGQVLMRLQASVPLSLGDDGAVQARFPLKINQTAYFVLAGPEWRPTNGDIADYALRALGSTSAFWRGWVAHSCYRGRWRETVVRSALVLKLLTYRPSGAMVAAPTFSLPETLGGQRNWDYRFTWIRDTSFAIYALMRLGYRDEAKAFMAWIEERCKELSDGRSLQVMYGIRGERDLKERELPHFSGYRQSRPVRVGNAAYNQLQLDIYGELMDAVFLFNAHVEPISFDFWRNLVCLIEWVEGHWHMPDDGIWEIRGGARPFLYSRVMCWVALDRALRIGMQRGFPCPMERWRRSRDAIFDDIMTNFWSQERQAFVQSCHGQATDASALMMPVVKFVGGTDPRWLSTMNAIRHDLLDDALVFRYQGDPLLEGLRGTEGTFSMCSFWYVQCLAQANELGKARLFFEKILSYANHLGLFSEELGPTGEHLGNFPQALTHLALIGAAFNLDRKLSQSGYIG